MNKKPENIVAALAERDRRNFEKLAIKEAPMTIGRHVLNIIKNGDPISLDALIDSINTAVEAQEKRHKIAEEKALEAIMAALSGSTPPSR
jgi:hypothetical protein